MSFENISFYEKVIFHDIMSHDKNISIRLKYYIRYNRGARLLGTAEYLKFDSNTGRHSLNGTRLKIGY